MTYLQLSINNQHPAFAKWFQTVKAWDRPIINAEQPSLMVVNASLPSQLQQSPCIEKIITLKQLPHLAKFEFMPNCPFERLEKPLIICGPCSIESAEQLQQIQPFMHKNDLKFLRGGLFKPRSKHSSFQGLGEEGIPLIRAFLDQNPCHFVTEVMSESAIDALSPITSFFQVGTRNMYNTPLLSALGKQDKPVILKRAMSATYDEWLNAAEYIISAGNPRVILCERGIRTFETQTRNCLDISAVPVLKSQSPLPIIIDPSHACGQSAHVPSLSRASIAAGADGIIFEAHPAPHLALSDGQQSLDLVAAEELIRDLRRLWSYALPTS